jgi:hypothetical protein
MRLIVLAAILLFAGCGAKTAAPQATFKIGDLDDKGRLIFWSMDAGDHVEPFTLRDNDHYGVVLYNSRMDGQPDARYIVAFQGSREIVHTDDFVVFKAALARIPRGSVIGRYDTCTLRRAYGLPDSIKSQFEKALGGAGLRVEEDARTVCYCRDQN